MPLSPNYSQSKWVMCAALLGTALTLLAPAAAQGRYHDGEFTGQAAETQWGDVQVKTVIRHGSVVDVQFLQYPYHRRRSAEISGYALPADLLNQAALAHAANGAFQQAFDLAQGRAANFTQSRSDDPVAATYPGAACEAPTSVDHGPEYRLRRRGASRLRVSRHLLYP